MAKKHVQKLFDFSGGGPTAPDQSPSQTTPEEAKSQPLAAVEQLEAWLTDPQTGKRTEEADEVVHTVRQAIIEGRNSYALKAEAMLETLALHNGRTHGDDIPPGPAPEGPDFHDTVEELLAALRDRLTTKGPGRSA